MGDFRTGFAKRIVTPPAGVQLAGYGPGKDRRVGAVLDDLWARALVLDDGKTRVALVSVDVICIGAEICRVIRWRIAEETGIKPENILITATHSHSAPTAAYFRHWGEMDANYVRSLTTNIGDAIIEAAKNTSPASIGFGQAEVRGIAVNRVRSKDGPVDHTLRVMAIRDSAGDKLRSVATTFPCHPVTMHMDSRFVSCDWPGRLVRDVERAHPDATAMFFQGALGDINPDPPWGGIDIAQDHGRKLAEATSRVLSEIRSSPTGDLSAASVDCDLPLDLELARREATDFVSRGIVQKHHQWLHSSGLVREWAYEMLGFLATNPADTLRCEVQAIRIGPDSAIVGLPGEMYTLIGEAIREESPFANTWVLGFSNGAIGYVTDPRDYEEITYASHVTPMIYGYPPYKPNAWRVIADAAVRALKEVT